MSETLSYDGYSRVTGKTVQNSGNTVLLYLWNTLLAVGAVSAVVSQVLCYALDAAFLLFWWKQLRQSFGKKHALSE